VWYDIKSLYSVQSFLGKAQCQGNKNGCCQETFIFFKEDILCLNLHGKQNVNICHQTQQLYISY
jgi:hypothetical protein